MHRLCQRKTSTGSQCHRIAVKGSSYCWQHKPKQKGGASQVIPQNKSIFDQPIKEVHKRHHILPSKPVPKPPTKPHHIPPSKPVPMPPTKQVHIPPAKTIPKPPLPKRPVLSQPQQLTIKHLSGETKTVLTFRGDVPMSILKCFDEFSDRIMNIPLYMNCCHNQLMNLLNMLKKTQAYISIARLQNTNTVVRAELSDYIEITPKLIGSANPVQFSNEINNLLISVVIPFLTVITDTYGKMLKNITEVMRTPVDRQVLQKTLIISDIDKVYQLYYKKYINEILVQCQFFIYEIEERVIRQRRFPFFNIQLSKNIEKGCNSQLDYNCIMTIFMQQAIRIQMLIGSLSGFVSKAEGNTTQFNKIKGYETHIHRVVKNLNELQGEIDDYNRTFFGAHLINMRIRTGAEISKLIHHCDICDKSKDINSCCVGDCKIKKSFLSKKCIYAP